MESPKQTLKKKRDQWTDSEIKSLLEIIKEKHILELLDNKTKRNKVIYTDIENELKKQNINKNCDQIRNKFKFLKSDYHKIKRNNNKSGAQRQTSMHYDTLDEMFSHRPSLTAEGVDTCDLDCNVIIESVTPLIAAEQLSTSQETAFSDTGETLEERPPTATTVNTIAETPDAAPSTSRTNLPKAAKKRSYETMVKSFTLQWQKTHEETMKKMIERDEQNWKRLEEHRRETDKILEKDRQETAQFMRSIFQFTSYPRPQFTFDSSYFNAPPPSPYSNNTTISPIHTSVPRSPQPMLNSSILNCLPTSPQPMLISFPPSPQSIVNSVPTSPQPTGSLNILNEDIQKE